MDTTNANDKYFQFRRDELYSREKEMGLLVYPHTFVVTTTIDRIKSKYQSLQNGDSYEEEYSISGRVLSWRE